MNTTYFDMGRSQSIDGGQFIQDALDYKPLVSPVTYKTVTTSTPLNSPLMQWINQGQPATGGVIGNQEWPWDGSTNNPYIITSDQPVSQWITVSPSTEKRGSAGFPDNAELQWDADATAKLMAQDMYANGQVAELLKAAFKPELPEIQDFERAISFDD